MRRIHRAHTSLFANGLGKIPIEALVDSGILLSTPPGYCQKIRIRASDVLGNKYITEYLSLGASLAYPVFREPWLGKDIVPRPARCSNEVSWEVEHFERRIGAPDEPVEKGFDISAPGLTVVLEQRQQPRPKWALPGQSGQ
ncbi:MAG TPA: hypothetical protein VIG32_08355 [Candidatus Baltobacteraceae bacterium]|jgi:hypothetical protein